jgi:DDE superfamily endonuclease
MKHGSMEIVIQRPILHGKLVKSGSPLVLSNVINAEKDGYFGAVFMVIERDLACFRRRIGVLSKRRPIKQRLYPLLTVGYVFVRMRASNWFLCKILRLLTPLKALLTTFARGIDCIHWPSYSPDLNPIETVWN